MKPIIRFSFVNNWYRGKFEEALKTLVNPDRILNPFGSGNIFTAMGSEVHTRLETYIREHNQLPPEFGFQVKPPLKPEVMYEKDYCDRYSFRCEVDVDSPEAIIDWKTGKTALSDWLASKQLGFYLYIVGGRKYGVIGHYNQYAETYEVGVKHCTAQVMQEALDVVNIAANDALDYCDAYDIPTRPLYENDCKNIYWLAKNGSKLDAKAMDKRIKKLVKEINV